MIVTFTDFGLAGPCLGQMKAALLSIAPQARLLDLMADAPIANPRAAAYLLAAYLSDFPRDTVFVCVVDPGVGTNQRCPVVMRANDQWFVGPENGLLEIVARRYAPATYWEIVWRPAKLSASFHGRDLFAPVAAWLAISANLDAKLKPIPVPPRRDWPDDSPEVVYIDHFGNAIVGLRAVLFSTSTIFFGQWPVCGVGPNIW